MANSLTLCFEIRIILARNNESCTLGNGSRRVRQESSRITATSRCQECVRPSHALAAFPNFLSGRSSLASPCLCLLEKPLSSHLISARGPRKNPSEHARMNTLGWNSVSLFKRHTSNDTLFENNEHVSGRHNDNEAVRFRHHTCARLKHSRTFRHPQCALRAHSYCWM